MSLKRKKKKKIIPVDFHHLKSYQEVLKVQLSVSISLIGGSSSSSSEKAKYYSPVILGYT